MAAGVAVLGEVPECVLGAGGSKRAAALAIVGSFIGGIVGTALPVPIVGTLIGACLGASTGSLLGDLWAGRPLFPSVEAGWGAAVGRFWGTVSKLAIGAIIVVVLAVAAFFRCTWTGGCALARTPRYDLNTHRCAPPILRAQLG
jgi:uncharacterized protein